MTTLSVTPLGRMHAERVALIGKDPRPGGLTAAFRESGVATLNVTPLGRTHAERVALTGKIRDLDGLTAAWLAGGAVWWADQCRPIGKVRDPASH